MTADFLSQRLGPKQIILERSGKADDMGGLALYLISKAGAYIDGGIHVSDGGRLALFASSF